MNAFLFVVLLGGIPGCDTCTTSVAEAEALEVRVACEATAGCRHAAPVPTLAHRPLWQLHRRAVHRWQHRRFRPLQRLWQNRPGFFFRRCR